jgi:hypothetical protein
MARLPAVTMLRTLLSQRRARVALSCTLGSVALLAIAPAAIAQQDVAANPPGVVAIDMSTDPQVASSVGHPARRR